MVEYFRKTMVMQIGAQCSLPSGACIHNNSRMSKIVLS